MEAVSGIGLSALSFPPFLELPPAISLIPLADATLELAPVVFLGTANLADRLLHAPAPLLHEATVACIFHILVTLSKLIVFLVVRSGRGLVRVVVGAYEDDAPRRSATDAEVRLETQEDDRHEQHQYVGLSFQHDRYGLRDAAVGEATCRKGENVQ